MGAGATCGTTVLATMENGTKTKSTASATTFGLISESMKASGATTICMEREFIPGATDESTKASTLTIASTVLASTRGKMVANTKATGTMASSMEMASIVRPMAKFSGAVGRKANEFSGTMSNPTIRTKCSNRVKTRTKFSRIIE